MKKVRASGNCRAGRGDFEVDSDCTTAYMVLNQSGGGLREADRLSNKQPTQHVGSLLLPSMPCYSTWALLSFFSSAWFGPTSFIAAWGLQWTYIGSLSAHAIADPFSRYTCTQVHTDSSACTVIEKFCQSTATDCRTT